MGSEENPQALIELEFRLSTGCDVKALLIDSVSSVVCTKKLQGLDSGELLSEVKGTCMLMYLLFNYVNSNCLRKLGSEGMPAFI